MIKVLHLNHSDISGGAARAAYRINSALNDIGIESEMWVSKKYSQNETIKEPESNLSKLLAIIKPHLASYVLRTLKTTNQNLHSISIFPTNWSKAINKSDCDIVNIHWINGEMISIEDIGRIKKPVVWTLHDMWPFCGAEHYTDNKRWKEGYTRSNRPKYEKGLDINKWTWKRKKRNWKNPMYIITPSRWLASHIKQSQIMKEWPVSVISHPLDLNYWKPIDKEIAKRLLEISTDRITILFGADSGTKDPRKGFDLLVEALNKLKRSEISSKIQLIIVGQSRYEKNIDLGFPTQYTGKVSDNLTLRIIYSAADMLVVPSREDMYPLTCMEAIACGTPVVTFRATGTKDMVIHKETGYLAEAFSHDDLCAGIDWIIQNNKFVDFRTNTVKYASENYDAAKIANQYYEIYKSILKNGLD